MIKLCALTSGKTDEGLMNCWENLHTNSEGVIEITYNCTDQGAYLFACGYGTDKYHTNGNGILNVIW